MSKFNRVTVFVIDNESERETPDCKFSGMLYEAGIETPSAEIGVRIVLPDGRIFFGTIPFTRKMLPEETKREFERG